MATGPIKKTTSVTVINKATSETLPVTLTAGSGKRFDFSIAEIEQKRPHDSGKYERFDFGISDAIVQEQLRLIPEDYGVSLNWFFVKTIAEKLTELGYSFKPTRKS